MLEDFFSIYDNKNNNRIRIEDIGYLSNIVKKISLFF